LLSTEWLGNLLFRLLEALTEPLVNWGADLGRPSSLSVRL